MRKLVKPMILDSFHTHMKNLGLLAFLRMNCLDNQYTNLAIVKWEENNHPLSFHRNPDIS